MQPVWAVFYSRCYSHGYTDAGVLHGVGVEDPQGTGNGGDLSLGERCRHRVDDSFFLVSTITAGHSSTKGLHRKTTNGSGADTSGGGLVIEG